MVCQIKRRHVKDAMYLGYYVKNKARPTKLSRERQKRGKKEAKKRQ